MRMSPKRMMPMPATISPIRMKSPTFVSMFIRAGSVRGNRDGAPARPGDELPHGRVLRVLDLRRRSYFQYLALVEHRDLVRYLVRGFHIMRDRDRRHPGLA